MNEIYYYKSNTQFEYCWFDNIHFIIQDTTDPFFNLEPYAYITTHSTVQSLTTLEYFKNEGLIQIIDKEFYIQRLNKCMEIIKNKCSPNLS